MLMNETHRFLQFFLGKIKAGEMTGVGIIFQPDVDSISAVLDGRLKRREVSGRAEQLHNLSWTLRRKGRRNVNEEGF